MTERIPKERIDVLLVERGLFGSREQAKRAVMAGIVFSGDRRIDKAGEKIPGDADIRVKGERMKYVSRGGLKLEKALAVFDLSVEGKRFLDIGASTGGFTDCALQNGAVHGYALDVGYNQLAWKLREDPRVTVMERVNFRHATPDMFTEGAPQFSTIDVSFISLGLILPTLKSILIPGGDVISLVKPQFEAGREKVGKKGIVRDPAVHLEVLEKIAGVAANSGFDLIAADYSPVTGGEGNIEFLFHLRSSDEPAVRLEDGRLAEVVREAHTQLDQ
ncbi:TlyA family RNA methyltransferase [Edaphobacillus lindanitolerans]|uniref:23S rRNA (Cytidine1920-2'-O)/16S rRNA (Cytidine1409-2'-O)-methyltransferase n=1 Tax=Edaphobacillus lindanitolerans TaxID=550447 RepID=A0A1U7PPD8_9BACI|nr:TlyA family RNA methyltransferase [Edaphobacillus lindanitolerans]SIT81652.1 23S rRNA (cytidine1920-2'-O)/16S rRNA (cytidine1409-2'-O)-methyltransferase [Edaphobacillus lindanitolerans]